jgi:PleD family two-component response regulator
VHTILVVDPTIDVRQAVIAAVDSSKTRLQWVDLESDAISVLRQNSVASVVINIDNRTADKLAFIDLLRHGRKTRLVHIIAVADIKNQQLLNEVLVAGASDFMSRPVHPDELLKRFQWATSMTRLERKRPLTSTLHTYRNNVTLKQNFRAGLQSFPK